MFHQVVALSEVLDPFCRHGDKLEDEGPYSAYHNRCTYSDCSNRLTYYYKAILIRLYYF